jgi:glutathione peroxidase
MSSALMSSTASVVGTKRIGVAPRRVHPAARVARVTRAACPCDDGDAPMVPTQMNSRGRREALLSAAALAAVSPAARALAAEPLKESFYDYTVSQYGKPFDLAAFKGGVTVVLNVASE